MARRVFNCTAVNKPKTVAGLEWRLVMAVSVFFGMAALMQRAPALLVAPVFILTFLSGPGRRDPLFLRIYIKHRGQRDFYTPAYGALSNQRTPRPIGFGRTNWF
jgi:hypothetical protein